MNVFFEFRGRRVGKRKRFLLILFEFRFVIKKLFYNLKIIYFRLCRGFILESSKLIVFDEGLKIINKRVAINCAF